MIKLIEKINLKNSIHNESILENLSVYFNFNLNNSDHYLFGNCNILKISKIGLNSSHPYVHQTIYPRLDVKLGALTKETAEVFKTIGYEERLQISKNISEKISENIDLIEIDNSITGKYINKHIEVHNNYIDLIRKALGDDTHPNWKFIISRIKSRYFLIGNGLIIEITIDNKNNVSRFEPLLAVGFKKENLTIISRILYSVSNSVNSANTTIEARNKFNNLPVPNNLFQVFLSKELLGNSNKTLRNAINYYLNVYLEKKQLYKENISIIEDMKERFFNVIEVKKGKTIKENKEISLNDTQGFLEYVDSIGDNNFIIQQQF